MPGTSEDKMTLRRLTVILQPSGLSCDKQERSSGNIKSTPSQMGINLTEFFRNKWIFVRCLTLPSSGFWNLQPRSTTVYSTFVSTSPTPDTNFKVENSDLIAIDKSSPFPKWQFWWLFLTKNLQR